MSRSLANALNPPIRCSGNRTEMVRSVGLRFGNWTRRADFQSTYSVVSCVAQNSRSSSSLRNFGTGLNFGMSLPLLPIHIAGRDDTNPLAPHGEYDGEPPSPDRPAEREVPRLSG